MLSSEMERDPMSTCQVDVRMEAGQASVQHMGDMAQGGIGVAEVSIKMLMSSKVSLLLV